MGLRLGEAPADPMMTDVAVRKALDLVGTGDTIQDAVTEGLDRARVSLEAITPFQV